MVAWGSSWWSGPQRPSLGDRFAAWLDSLVNSFYLLTYPFNTQINGSAVMTLILGRISADRIHIGADGLSTSTRLGEQPGRTTLRKLFPMVSRPVAIAQVGSNSVKRDGRDSSLSVLVREALEAIEAQHPDSAIDQLALTLANQIWCACESGDFTLWLVGFEEASGMASVNRVEVCRSTGAVRPIVESLNADAIIDGSGRRFVVSFHDDLFDTFTAAIGQQEVAGEASFGGHWHSLEIVPQRPPAWVRHPRTGSLGLRDLLDQRDTGDDRRSFSPQVEIGTQMARLKNALSERAQTERGKRPRTIQGCIDHWERGRTVKRPPDWKRVFRLVAIGDEADVADSGDISEEDAMLYQSHVGELVASLPPPL